MSSDATIRIILAFAFSLAGLAEWAAGAQNAAPLCQTGMALVVFQDGPGGRVTEFASQRNTPLRTRTSATVRWDASGLRVAFDCADTNIVAQQRPRGDTQMWQNDCVEIFLDIGHTHNNAGPRFHVLVSAAGGILEQVDSLPGYQARLLSAKADITADGWSAEISIPWEALGAQPKLGDVWGFNLNREEHPDDEYPCWSPTWGGFDNFQQWGHLVFAGTSAEHNKEIAMTTARKIADKHTELHENARRHAEHIARVAREEGLGCEANPTGDPIGGGPGYRNIFTNGDFTARTAAELLAALKQAKPGQRIFVPDGARLDLAGQENIALPAGITLAGSRGLSASSGGRITMQLKQIRSYDLFRTAGDNVRVTGLIFEGPDGDNAQHNGYANLLVTTHYGLEVDNCEIANWGYGAVVGRPGASAIYVHHSHIHHCQGAAHDGYGVSLDACDARVIANKLAAVRNHVISGTGNPGTAYEAAFNWVDGNFDMHGGGDRGDATDIGGDWMDIHHNNFQQPHAINCITRGIPSQGARVHHNRFAASLKTSSSCTKEELAKRNIHAYRNLNGADNILEE